MNKGVLLSPFLCPLISDCSVYMHYFAEMKTRLFLTACFLFAFAACSTDDNASPTSDSDVDAASNFIRASLDNNFDEARKYIVADSTNTEYLDAVKRNRANLTKAENFNYREASIQVYDTRKINDSASIVTYSNSYKKQKDSVKVIRVNGQWLVDFKYSFPGNPAK
ncbi:MAG: hypothetical protein JWP88_1929 [Flaviaesturariibacter sp.]|nr:hypothetical protein [Flaviaesturariibacter sp.]